MNWRNSTTRYGALSIGLHWLMLLLVAAVYVCIEAHERFPKGSAMRADLKTWHFMLGLAVLALVAIRVVVIVASATPRIEPAPPRWQQVLARLTHGALYGLMIAMPLLGWLVLSAEGKAIPFFGLQLPALVAPSETIASWAEELHEVGGTVGYVLIGLHAAAALFHHHVLRDNTLRRMWPAGG